MMKLQLRWSERRDRAPAIASSGFVAIALTLALMASASQVQACSGGYWEPVVTPVMQVHLEPKAIGGMREWSEEWSLAKEDLLAVLLSNRAKVEIQGDKAPPSVDRLKEDDPWLNENRRKSDSTVAGHTWWYFRATRPGNSVIRIDDGAQKTLKVSFKETVSRKWREPPPAPPPEPKIITPEQATKEKPFSMSAGLSLFIILPGELKEGWHADDDGGKVIEMFSVQKMDPDPDTRQPRVKLVFHVPRSSYTNREPYQLVVKNGASLFGSKSYNIYLHIHPLPKC